MDVVAGSAVHNILQVALEASNLNDALNGTGPFTVFAPTDDAFNALGSDLIDDLLENPGGALSNILLYHVVSGTALSSDLSDGQSITTLYGDNVEVTINQDGVFINDAQVIIENLSAGNGVVHVINAVLLPSTNPNTVMDIIATSDDHNTLQVAEKQVI